MEQSGTLPAQSPAALTAPIPCSPQDFQLLAQLVHAEAANQPFAGQVAVAAVVLNRLRSPGFPKTISAIIEEPGQFESFNSARFWSRPGAIAYQAVRSALNGWDPAGGALYYYNPQLPYAAWMNTLPVTATIGSQIFCH
jgi:N-acetylmuramoyl-L-alanine amidase